MNFSYYQSLLISPKLSAWIILIWNLRVVKEVEKRSMIDYRWMRVTLDTFYTAWYVSVTTWTSLASSQHYYAVVSKNHVCCIKIDRYIGSSTIIITTYCDIQAWKRLSSGHSVAFGIRPPSFCFGLHIQVGSCFCSPFGGKFTLKTLRSHRSRFLRLTLQK